MLTNASGTNPENQSVNDVREFLPVKLKISSSKYPWTVRATALLGSDFKVWIRLIDAHECVSQSQRALYKKLQTTTVYSTQSVINSGLFIFYGKLVRCRKRFYRDFSGEFFKLKAVFLLIWIWQTALIGLEYSAVEIKILLDIVRSSYQTQT